MVWIGLELLVIGVVSFVLVSVKTGGIEDTFIDEEMVNFVTISLSV